MDLPYEVADTFEEHCEWFEKNLRIRDVTGKVVPLQLFPHQLQMERHRYECLLAGIPCHMIVLKARQEGVSTYTEAALYRMSREMENQRVMVTAHTEKASRNLFGMAQRFHEHLPDAPETTKMSARSMKFSDNDSEFTVDTAGAGGNAGRSDTLSGFHGCFPAETPVVVANGKIIRADEVVVGDEVITHTGKKSHIAAVIKRINDKKCVTITPWLGKDITLTENHKVWTKRGWVLAGDLTMDDVLQMPVRKIETDDSQWPDRVLKKSPPKGFAMCRSHRSGAGEKIRFDEEFGFAVGYFLAEGCLTWNHKKHPNSICFSRHEDETDYGDRAWGSLRRFCSSRTIRTTNGSKTVMEQLFSAALAEWFAENLYLDGDKILPDWFFSTNRLFLQGVLVGYLSGDGSKAPEKYSRMRATSIRSSLTTQIRDIAASLGIGWGSISFREGAVRVGRNEQDAWTVSWAGEAARNLREMVGLPNEVSQMDRKYFQHTSLEEDSVWIDIRKIQESDCDIVYDFEVADEDHSFRTTHFSISNSEIDFWPAPDDLFVATMQCLHGVPGELIVLESTANGPMGFMQRVWNQATEGRSSFKPFFFAWHDFERYQRPLSWEDLEAYGPRDWVNQNRAMIRRGKANVHRSEDEGKSGSGSGGRSGDEAVADAGKDRKGRSGSEGGKDPADVAGKRKPSSRAKTEPGGKKSGRGASGTGGRKRRGDEGNVGSEPTRLRGGIPGEGLSGRPAGTRPYGVKRKGDPNALGTKGNGAIQYRTIGLEAAYLGSLDETESSNKMEFNLSLEQLNWRRFILETKCMGDETKMRREYPARPDEAFEASGGDILDQRVLAQWAKAATETPPKARVRMTSRERVGLPPIIGYETEDRSGKVEIYHWPNESPSEKRPGKFQREYVMGVDCSSGVSDGDWTVACVLDVDTGEQVAEFRAKMDPDLAVDQIEWLGLFYNKAYTAIEITGGHGGPFVRHIHQRGWLPLYERKTYDRGIGQWTRRPGWDTTTKTRPTLVSESKVAVREETCLLHSAETIRECRLLWESPSGKIEARPSFHDDGWISFAIAIVIRNEKLGLETLAEKEERHTESFLQVLDSRARAQENYEQDRFSQITANMPVDSVFVGSGERQRPDGRRSWL